MAGICATCGKKPSFGHNVSFSHRKTNRRWNPNLQVRHTTINGVAKKYKICTQCMRTELKRAAS